MDLPATAATASPMSLLTFYASPNEETLKIIANFTPTDFTTALELGAPGAARIKNANKAHVLLAPHNAITSDLPVAKGQAGEAFVEEVLVKNFGETTNVSKVSKSGDLSLYIQHRKISIEVKNYSNPVPASGVEKFQRDLSVTNACGGVFISLKSPISTVTSDFIIRHEPVVTGVIPCAYIVSSDANCIVVAVRMIASLIQSYDHIKSELYNKDVLAVNVHDTSRALQSLARARNDLQANIGTLTTHMIKSLTDLVGAETLIRAANEGMFAELFHSTTLMSEPVMCELGKLAAFAKYPHELRVAAAEVISVIQSVYVNDISAWKISAKKCSHTTTGIHFNFAPGKIEVGFLKSKLPTARLSAGINDYCNKVSMTSTTFVIELDAQTISWVTDTIRGKNSLPIVD